MTATRISEWDALVERFSPRTASMEAILADAEGWRKWCEANPEKCAYVPKGHTRLKGLKSQTKEGTKPKASLAMDVTMVGLADLSPKVASAVESRFTTSLGVTPKEAGDNLDAVFDEGIANPQMAAYATWYEDAHAFANFAATTEGRQYDTDVAAAVTAALSPGGEWNENRRQADTVMGAVHRNEMIDPDVANALLARAGPDGRIATDYQLSEPMTLRDMVADDPRAAGIYIGRLNHFPLRTYDNVTKAITLANANDPKTIDSTLTGAKVRSFFNNISEPRSAAGDVTIDKHMQRVLAIGAERDETVIAERVDRIEKDQSALTGSPSFRNASLGAYPLMADVVRAATVRANERHGLSLTASQFQAVVWGWQTLTYPAQRMRTITEKSKTASCDECGAIVADAEDWARWREAHPYEPHPRHHAQGVDKMKEALLRDGGFTINPRNGKLVTTGYTVAIAGHSSITSSADFFDDGHATDVIDSWLAEQGDTFDVDATLNIGGWYDREHDEIVLDPSKNFDDEAEATKLGRDWDQQSIYDHANNREIPTGGTGQRAASACEDCGAITADSAGWRKWCEENPEKCGGPAKPKPVEVPGQSELFNPADFTYPGPHLKDVVPTPPEFTAWEKEQADIADEVRVQEESDAADALLEAERAARDIMGDEDPNDPDFVPKAGAMGSWTPDLAVELMQAYPERYSDYAAGFQAEGFRLAQEHRAEWAAEMSEEDQVWLRDRVSEYLSNGRVVTRVDDDILQEILADGAWETQFTTGTSGGMYDPEVRRETEGLWMGVDFEEEVDRPIYATWVTPSTDPDLTSQYGDIEVILKRDVESRATVSLRDSLGTEVLPQPFSVMRNGSLRQIALADSPYPTALQELFDGNTPSAYTEVQIHRGLKTSDIEHVVFRESEAPPFWHAPLAAKLDEQGIPWSVIPDYAEGSENEYPVPWEVPSEPKAAGLRRDPDQRTAVGRDDPDHPQRQAAQAGFIRGAHERRRAASVASCDECHGPITADSEGWRKWREEHPYQPHPRAKRADPTVARQAQLLAAEAKRIEPAITAMMQGLAARHGGELVGLDFRLKAEAGLARKIEADMTAKGISAEDAAKGIGDAVRYTVSFDPDTYSSGAEAVLADVRAAGYGVRVKNFWAKGDPYNGVNVKLTDPTTGRDIELQFHTADSHAIKEGAHKMYESYRVLPVGDPARTQLWDRMVSMADNQPFPANVERLGPLLLQDPGS